MILIIVITYVHKVEGTTECKWASGGYHLVQVGKWKVGNKNDRILSFKRLLFLKYIFVVLPNARQHMLPLSFLREGPLVKQHIHAKSIDQLEKPPPPPPTPPPPPHPPPLPHHHSNLCQSGLMYRMMLLFNNFIVILFKHGASVELSVSVICKTGEHSILYLLCTRVGNLISYTSA